MGDFTNSVQRHDFEPGIEPSGLFWTMPAPDDAIDVDAREGTARLRMRNVRVPDFHDFANAVSPNPTSDPGRVTFDVRWEPSAAPVNIHDDTFGFSGRFVPGTATISFVVRNERTGVTYRSDVGPQTTVSGGVGRERNGVFFH